MLIVRLYRMKCRQWLKNSIMAKTTKGQVVPTFSMEGWAVLKKTFIKPTFKSNLKPLTKEQFKEFQEIVNVHRPYCSSDFVKQHFIGDLSDI